MALMQVAATKAATVKTSAAGGAFAGKTLGLGLGLGAWGPVALGLIGAAAVYGYVRSRKAEQSQTEEELELAAFIAGA